MSVEVACIPLGDVPIPQDPSSPSVHSDAGDVPRSFFHFYPSLENPLNLPLPTATKRPRDEDDEIEGSCKRPRSPCPDGSDQGIKDQRGESSSAEREPESEGDKMQIDLLEYAQDHEIKLMQKLFSKAGGSVGSLRASPSYTYGHVDSASDESGDDSDDCSEHSAVAQTSLAPAAGEPMLVDVDVDAFVDEMESILSEEVDDVIEISSDEDSSDEESEDGHEEDSLDLTVNRAIDAAMSAEKSDSPSPRSRSKLGPSPLRKSVTQDSQQPERSRIENMPFFKNRPLPRIAPIERLHRTVDNITPGRIVTDYMFVKTICEAMKKDLREKYRDAGKRARNRLRPLSSHIDNDCPPTLDRPLSRSTGTRDKGPLLPPRGGFVYWNDTLRAPVNPFGREYICGARALAEVVHQDFLNITRDVEFTVMDVRSFKHPDGKPRRVEKPREPQIEDHMDIDQDVPLSYERSNAVHDTIALPLDDARMDLLPHEIAIIELSKGHDDSLVRPASPKLRDYDSFDDDMDDDNDEYKDELISESECYSNLPSSEYSEDDAVSDENSTFGGRLEHIIQPPSPAGPSPLRQSWTRTLKIPRKMAVGRINFLRVQVGLRNLVQANATLLSSRYVEIYTDPDAMDFWSVHADLAMEMRTNPREYGGYTTADLAKLEYM
ncbi:uncharacterized protein BXZ73DRAFT_100082 [Epithele typhae]|uniref:uncharacterized protein n=1 Tax=Epithele typhae TaxID=378194 RepID=UPI0020078BF4|nr:uncharacterized protein BXZ73DRAFT_100082 [Epithele typhae]KAH9937870.1 hypothetical protein BXZ73DRAFT_100082 [Epithele typhae]